MKILYSVGNRPAAGIQLKRFLDHTKHSVRVAAYMTASSHLSRIDWTLDALRTRNHFRKHQVNELFGYTGLPFVDVDNIEYLLDDVVEWAPDLIISDGERICAHVAHVLDIALWYCSPLHLLDGVIWDFPQTPYRSVLKKEIRRLNSMPTAEKKLIYSPLGDVSMRPLLADGVEWVTPYIDKPQKIRCADSKRAKSDGMKLFSEHFDSGYFCAGETSYIADAIYKGKPIYISPSTNDTESLLNALFCKQYNLGVDLGEIDDKRYALRCLNKMPAAPNTISMSIQNYPQLHQLL